MTAYYNEFDPEAAATLRELIKAGAIAAGDVDERSIVDVGPDDLRGYTQCHFFAGVGVWSYALRLAGWPDDKPVWTGSCPCPPFSAAGKGQRCPDCGSRRNLCHPRKTGHFICLDCGCDRYADDRHLWPEFARLIRERNPAVVFGEQVASADGRLWLGTVRADLETMGRAVGGADLCAAGVGAPHIRQRLWFATDRGVAQGDAFGTGLEGQREGFAAEGGRVGEVRPVAEAGEFGRMADAEGGGRREERTDGRRCIVGDRAERQPAGLGDGRRDGGLGDAGCEPGQWHTGSVQGAEGSSGSAWRPDGHDSHGHPNAGAIGGMADAERFEWFGRGAGEAGVQQGSVERAERLRDAARGEPATRPPHNPWRDADWLFCRDGRWRPVESGTFPLAHGAPARVGRLRVYGNAIVAQAAAAFIRSYIETRSGFA